MLSFTLQVGIYYFNARLARLRTPNNYFSILINYLGTLIIILLLFLTAPWLETRLIGARAESRGLFKLFYGLKGRGIFVGQPSQAQCS